MTIERYNTPNHPRWYPRATSTPTTAEEGQRYGRNYAHRDGCPPDGRPRSGTPFLVPRDTTEDESTIELRNTSDRVLITAELPDRSLDDVRVSVSGATIRIQAAPRDASPQANGLDRTISLPETVTAADVVTVYNEPTLTVIVSIEN